MVSLSLQTIITIEEMLEEELTDITGTLFLLDHQATLLPNFRKIPPEQLAPENLKNLRLRKFHLENALEEMKLNYPQK